jgi:hypothetical protein
MSNLLEIRGFNIRFTGERRSMAVPHRKVHLGGKGLRRFRYIATEREAGRSVVDAFSRRFRCSASLTRVKAPRILGTFGTVSPFFQRGGR